MKHHAHDPERSFATAMVRHAIKDMRHKELTSITDHVGAVCWLGSKGSTKWFDGINIDQESSLPKLGWDRYAKDILSDNEIPLSDDQREVLTATLKYFQRSHRGNDDA
jgi:hypothetical protein